jgi:small-conductance mechanosensitive channel
LQIGTQALNQLQEDKEKLKNARDQMDNVDKNVSSAKKELKSKDLISSFFYPDCFFMFELTELLLLIM